MKKKIELSGFCSFDMPSDHAVASCESVWLCQGLLCSLVTK